jgi:hypothetical protein
LPVRRIPTRRNNVRRGQALRRTGRLYVVLTRTQAERELRRLVDATTVVAKGQRRTVGEAGDAYVAHLENVMERKRTTIADDRGYLRRHLAPSFGYRPMDRIEPGQVERWLHAKGGDGLSPKTVQNHLNFLDRAQRRTGRGHNDFALADHRAAHCSVSPEAAAARADEELR